MLTKYLWVFFVSMVPLVELRGSIIISQGLRHLENMLDSDLYRLHDCETQ